MVFASVLPSLPVRKQDLFGNGKASQNGIILDSRFISSKLHGP